jgi:hypothetical protein
MTTKLPKGYEVLATCFGCNNSEVDDSGRAMEIWCKKYKRYVWVYAKCDDYKDYEDSPSA